MPARRRISKYAIFYISFLAAEDVAQLFAVEPGSGGAFGADVCHRGIKVGLDVRVEFRPVLEECLARPSQAQVDLLLDAPRSINRRIDTGHDVEVVEGNTSIRRMLAHSLDEGWRHADGNRFTACRAPPWTSGSLAKVSKGVSTTPLGDKEHLAFIRIGKHADVVVPLDTRGFIHGEAGYLGEVGIGQHHVDIALADGGCPMPGQLDRLRHSSEQHLAAQGNGQRLGQQRKDGQLPCPTGSD